MHRKKKFPERFLNAFLWAEKRNELEKLKTLEGTALREFCADTLWVCLETAPFSEARDVDMPNLLGLAEWLRKYDQPAASQGEAKKAPRSRKTRRPPGEA